MIIISRDVTDPSEQPFIIADHKVTNSDGSVSFALDAAGTKFAGQEPNQYGVRNDSTGAPGEYQKATQQGALVTFWPQTPQGPSKPFTYTIVEPKVYA